MRITSNLSHAGASAFFPQLFLVYSSSLGGLISAETQIHKRHSFPFHQYRIRRYARRVSGGRTADVRHLRSFYQKHISSRRRQRGHRLTDVLWVRPSKKTSENNENWTVPLPFLTIHSTYLTRTSGQLIILCFQPVLRDFNRTRKRLSIMARQYL